ncbi:MAG: asparagine synthase (glutamine-hydrolyzing) [Candidatus Acidiferrales bacterium]
MCGIAGFVDIGRETSSEELRRIGTAMVRTLHHRGPDDEGVWVEPSAGVALAHRRLSILDLSAAGHQPMAARCSRYTMVLNGEIYNFAELRQLLKRAGHRFRGHSDTEVLLETIAKWGIERALTMADGMFAFALWDAALQELHLARDRFGEKPLYYGWAGRHFVFASELKAFRVHPAFDAELDLPGINDYLSLDFIPAPRSIYKHILKLLPGHRLVLSADRRLLEPIEYWSALRVLQQGTEHPFEGDETEAVATLDSVLRRAVRSRMHADVPLGAFLSGGIDSSTVVALMQAQSARPVRTFTIGLRQNTRDEAQHAKKVAAHLGTDHVELYASANDAAEIIPTLATIYDEPFSDSSQIPTLLVSRLARQSVTVALSGDGGDEIFGGYNRYVWGACGETLAHIMPAVARLAVARVVQHAPERWAGAAVASAFRLFGRVRAASPNRALHRMAVVMRCRRATDLHAELIGRLHEPWHMPADRAPADLGLPTVRSLMYLDTVSYLPDDILVKIDRASMAVSLETRVPLLNPHVLELAARLPVPIGFLGRKTKHYLRQVLYRYVPREMVDRPKMGFSVPMHEWLRGGLREWAEALLTVPALNASGFDPKRVRLAWQQHLSGAVNAEHEIWNVLMLQAWMETHREHGAAALPAKPLATLPQPVAISI